MTKATNDFGELGERIAARWLEHHGYTVLARRWRSGHRDIDVVAQRDGVVAFVEVKTRSAMEFGDPVEAVHAQKQRSLVRSAREWIARHQGTEPNAYRFDVIGVLLRDSTVWVRHIESAFLM
ncbi:MAG: YraN family protein [Gemmatimonadetes bacterium]|nr:YraN family protein [Gemmatimonadota bacterium]